MKCVIFKNKYGIGWQWEYEGRESHPDENIIDIDHNPTDDDIAKFYPKEVASKQALLKIAKLEATVTLRRLLDSATDNEQLVLSYSFDENTEVEFEFSKTKAGTPFTSFVRNEISKLRLAVI